ncbi:MAG: hypothetical protein J3K34DRAFT_439556 [Monoraphidium minutum]|nr:MAG: hypothetical protein J3K34DRAFT_439556 [Monoraphidium minutum]
MRVGRRGPRGRWCESPLCVLCSGGVLQRGAARGRAAGGPPYWVLDARVGAPQKKERWVGRPGARSGPQGRGAGAGAALDGGDRAGREPHETERKPANTTSAPGGARNHRRAPQDSQGAVPRRQGGGGAKRARRGARSRPAAMRRGNARRVGRGRRRGLFSGCRRAGRYSISIVVRFSPGHGGASRGAGAGGLARRERGGACARPRGRKPRAKPEAI